MVFLAPSQSDRSPPTERQEREVPYAGHAGDDDVRHIPVFGNNLQPFDRFAVSNNVLKHLRSVFFNPKKKEVVSNVIGRSWYTYHGSS